MRVLTWFLFACGTLASATVAAEEVTLPSPVATIYPGEIVRENMLYDALFDVRESHNAARTRGDVIGRVAKRTLFAGRPIGLLSIDEPQTIANGSLVQVVYEQPGISISASGLALQSARTGDAIRVRNVETGLVVSGIVSAVGIVMVGR